MLESYERVKRGKMKQQTQTNQIEWKEVEIGNEDYFKIVSSGINPFDGEKDYLSTESIKRTRIEKVESKITYENRPSRANMQPVLNSVWFAKMQSTLKVYAFTKDNKKEVEQYILSTGFAGIQILNKEIFPDYIRIYLATKMFNSEKDKLSTGSTQRGINNSLIIKMKIPLPFSNGSPHLKEQERIVKILEESEKINRKSKNVEILFNEYLKGVFYEMFFNKGFEEVKIEKGILKTENKNPEKDFPDKYFYYIDIASVDNNSKKIIETKNILGKEAPSRAKQLVKYNDLLISTVRPNLNAVTLVPRDLDNQICSTGFCIIRADNKTFIPEYLFFISKTDSFVNSLIMKCRGANYPAVSDRDIRSLKIPLPPIPLQQKFARIVEQVEKMKEKINKTKQNSEELFNSLVSKGFRGEL